MLLGVDIGGTKCALILAENDGTIVSRVATATTNVTDTVAWIVNGAKELAEAALSDKKRRGGEITLILPKTLGKSVLYPLPAEQLEAFL